PLRFRDSARSGDFGGKQVEIAVRLSGPYGQRASRPGHDGRRIVIPIAIVDYDRRAPDSLRIPAPDYHAVSILIVPFDEDGVKRTIRSVGDGRPVRLPVGVAGPLTRNFACDLDFAQVFDHRTFWILTCAFLGGALLLRVQCQSYQEGSDS